MTTTRRAPVPNPCPTHPRFSADACVPCEDQAHYDAWLAERHYANSPEGRLARWKEREAQRVHLTADESMALVRGFLAEVTR